MDSRRGSGYNRKPEQRLVLIGVQARTNSTRLPNKANLEISGRTIIEHVMDACDDAARYLTRNFERYSCMVRTAMLVPHGDPLIARYSNRYDVRSYPSLKEDDVLSRYWCAGRELNADYVVRITGDCVFTAPYLVSRCIKSSLFNGYDYVSNCLIRTFREGMDVEVISADLLEFLNKQSVGDEREHVTLLMKSRDKIPAGCRIAHILNDVDDSFIKTSIDTKEDYERAVAEKESLASKRKDALMHGDTAL